MRRKSNLDKLLLGVVILLVAQVIELSIKLLFLPKAPGIEIGYLDWRSYYIDETPLNISRCWRLGRLLLIPVIYFFYHLGEQYGIIDNTLSMAFFYHIMKFIFSKNLFIGIFGFFVFLYVLQNPNWESTDPRKAKSLRDYLNRRHNQEMYERSKAQTRENVTLFTLIIGLLTFRGLRRLRVYLKEIRSF